MNHRPLLLVVLDGWGFREEAESNAIRQEAGYFHDLLGRYPNTLLSASGREVGLPLGLMGNSEVGHLNLGAGRTVYMDVTRIDKAIDDGEFQANGALAGAMEKAARTGKQLHLVGLVSDGGVHASDHHLRALLKLAAARGLAPEQVVVHAILDGRDTPPRSADRYLAQLERDIVDAGVGRIASVVGRYWAMDRDKRWDRVQRAYELFVGGRGERVASSAEAVQRSYAANVGDEFVEPFVVGAPDQGRMRDGDVVLCFNFRADRMRQLCEALGLTDFDGFDRGGVPRLELVTMTQYRADFPFAVAFPPRELKGVLSEVLAAQKLTQKRIAETEKYAHVTYFFSGGKEAPVAGEDRVLVPSPKVATYDLQPEMSAEGITEAILASLKKDDTDVYIINYANADMVGHTGIWTAACSAIRTIDACLARLVPEVTRRGGLVAITADHGNSEQLWDPVHNSPHTAHTTNPVPIVLCAEDLVGAKLRRMGVLGDVAPTLLELAGVPKPEEMSGLSLLER
ncbi:MAG: 2,3-bisphosphoglycerate-independent phosphoglycerate mutase [Planctomycetes bacterium]|nr:2,3-bisphosphoglycerate-independent phosphoglycerate mutase [Planctomycetota bacterium]